MYSVFVAAFAVQAFAWSVQTQEYGGAPAATGEPAGVSYEARLQLGKHGAGYLNGVTRENGIGVDINIGFTELLAEEGPFGKSKLASPPNCYCTDTLQHTTFI
jgi:hypothetical protein